MDGPVDLVKAIATYMVFAGAKLEMGAQSFKLIGPPPVAPSAEMHELRPLLQA